jgi:spore germination protein YaaH
MLLFALLAALGPHALDAAAHAAAPEAAWVSATPRLELAAPAPALTKRVYGYLPYWQSIDLTTFRWDLVSDVIAFSAGIATDGTVSNTHALPGAALVSAAHAHGVKVHLCATLFNSSGGSEIATFLASSAARAKAVQQLVALMNGIEGLDLDFEFVPSTSRSAFTSFVTELHQAMPAGSELTIAMPSTIGYTGYDAAALSASTERLLLMEYDWHWRTSPTSGANAPLPSDENAVAGFLTVAPAASLAMGVPYYGYDWPTATTSPGSSTSGAGATVLFGAVFGKFSTYGRLWDSASQTPWYRYSASAQNHQGWVDDDQSLALKYAYVSSKGLAGIMIWALGYDGARTEAWSAIETAFGATTPPPTTPGALQIVSASFAPSSLDPGGLVTATLHVRNTGGQSIEPTAPPPTTVYDEPQSSTGSIAGTWRLALDVADRPAAQQAHPWRWGVGQSLAPGAETDVAVQVRLERNGTRTLWAAVVHEGVDVPQDGVAPTNVLVGAAPVVVDAGVPDRNDAGDEPPAAVVASGCAQAGASPWALLALLSLRIRRKRD